MSRNAVTITMALIVPFVVVGEIQALCAVLDLPMTEPGKAMSIFFGLMASGGVGIARHG